MMEPWNIRLQRHEEVNQMDHDRDNVELLLEEVEYWKAKAEQPDRWMKWTCVVGSTLLWVVVLAKVINRLMGG